jgi:hypothetical protein
MSRRKFFVFVGVWLRGLDLNQRPLGYEPNELPGCSTPHSQFSNHNSDGSTLDRLLSR